jgi:manganese/iron transport system permease protein
MAMAIRGVILMIDQLVAPFAYPYMQRAAVAAIIVGGLCSLIGVFVVLRRLSFIGDGIAHASFAGIVVAYMEGANYLIGASIVAVLSALGIGILNRRGVALDSAIGVVFTGAFALGIFLMSRITKYTGDLQDFLFGNILAVSSSDLWAISILAAIICIMLFVLFRPLVYTSFDPIVAEASGIRAGVIDIALLVSLALTIVLSLEAVGIVLVAALLVTPAATAALVARRMREMLVVSFLIGISCALGGLYISYYLSSGSSGATIVLLTTVVFMLVLAGREVHNRFIRTSVEDALS